MSEAVLEVEALNTWFYTRKGVLKAVRDVSFSLGRGEVLGIVGESGSGKSVTGMSVMGLVDPPGRIVSGHIRLDGEPLEGLDFERMREIRGSRIAMVFQNPLMTLNPVLRIREQMFEAIAAHERVPVAEMRRRAVEALQAVGIPAPEARLDAYPHELSGGMRQRVVVAIAIMLEPDVIIADEPTTALDVTIQAQIIHEMRGMIDRRGMAMIWISHDLATLSELADRILVMYAGAMMETGSTADIIAGPRHPYTKRLLASAPSRNRPGEKLAQIPGTMVSLMDVGPGCPFANRCERVVAACATPVPETRLSPGRSVWCHNPEVEA
ncbi:ABC transporter ATP-binding protein [Acuticoccus sediminis]|uniref:ABC transporter ATP-binding protein n=1 Tax=Acuticoccus sediminis TaxID=2184697 RepID=UPI001CFD6A9C|nr:ABC transporter ATP-binding protein [Acuticoccus sediminis]